MTPQILERRSTCETTEVFDAVDRWRIAEKYGIDRIHEKSRAEIFHTVAGERRTGDFQNVVREIGALHPSGDTDPHAFSYINMDEFLSDQDTEIPDQGILHTFAETHRWLRETISQHCPYVGPSLRNGRIWISAVSRENSSGGALFSALETSRDILKDLSPEDDRLRNLNAFLLLAPEMRPPRLLNMAAHMSNYVQEFGAECGDFVLGSFCPSMMRSRVQDTKRAVPPMFVLRRHV